MKHPWCCSFPWFAPRLFLYNVFGIVNCVTLLLKVKTLTLALFVYVQKESGRLEGESDMVWNRTTANLLQGMGLISLFLLASRDISRTMHANDQPISPRQEEALHDHLKELRRQ